MATAQLGPRPTTVRQPTATAANRHVSPNAPRARGGKPREPSAPTRVVKPRQVKPRAIPPSPGASLRERFAKEARPILRGAVRQVVRATQGVVRTVTYAVPRAMRFVTRALEQVVGS